MDVYISCKSSWHSTHACSAVSRTPFILRLNAMDASPSGQCISCTEGSISIALQRFSCYRQYRHLLYMNIRSGLGYHLYRCT